MNDLISRREAIDAIGALSDAMFKNIEKGATYPKRQWFDGMANAQSIIEDLPSAQQWIPVSERLPEEEKMEYWVCTDTGYQCQCRWTNDVYGLGASDRWKWKIFDIPQYQKVVAWMPLPEPYRKDGD